MKPLKRVGGESLQVRVSRETAAKIAEIAKSRNVSVSQVIRDVLLNMFGS